MTRAPISRSWVKRAQRALGADVMLRDSGFDSSPELRAAAREAWEQIPPQTRRSQLARELRAQSIHRRYSVGRVEFHGMFFVVLGEGDTWAQAIACAVTRKERQRQQNSRDAGH